MRDAFLATLAALNPPRPFALAVSGGPDSMALMHLAAGLKPTVLTIDHGLRREAAAETAKVGAWAAALGLRHISRRWTDEKPSAGIQAAARTARYNLLAQLCADVGAAALLTGHTLDDQIETAVMRGGRGSGPIGLAGMPSQSLIPGSKVRLVRPLLATRKAALASLLAVQGQDFITDPSNVDLRFDRARLRAAPSGPDDLQGIVGMQCERIAVESQALAFLNSHATQSGDPAWLVPRTVLAVLPEPVNDIVLSALLRRVGSRPYSGTRAERQRLRAAIHADGVFFGRTLANARIRRATRAEAGGGQEFLAFESEGLSPTYDGGWWLPFGQYAQLLADGLIVHPSTMSGIH